MVGAVWLFADTDAKATSKFPTAVVMLADRLLVPEVPPPAAVVATLTDSVTSASVGGEHAESSSKSPIVKDFMSFLFFGVLYQIE